MSKDPLAAALGDLKPVDGRVKTSKIDKTFGDRPEVLDAIVRMRERGHTYTAISDALLEHAGFEAHPTVVANWIKSRKKEAQAGG